MTLPPAREGTRPSKVTLTLGRSLSYRGDPLFVSGQVTGTHGGGARAGGTVQVVLRDREDSKVLGLLGVATTDASGGWVVEVAVPPNWPPGSYDVRAEFLGDRSLGPSVSP